MENREFSFKGVVLNGFLMLFVIVALVLCSIAGFVLSALDDSVALALISALMLISAIVFLFGFVKLEPNEANVMMFFGKYCGTFLRTGFYWVNPFINAKKVSMRARNLDAEPIKVNDKNGNPILIGMVLVWKLKDTYKALFEIDAQTMAQANIGKNEIAIGGSGVANVMNAFEQFVLIQSDAALRQVAGLYAYDDTDNNMEDLTLRGGGEEINQELVTRLNERLALAGIEVVEARINYLAYAPEIAAVMLRRQQADAIIAAREKIVEGAVSMVKMALQRLSEDDVVDMDDEKKAAMVSNLMVVLCGDNSAQPVVNAGTLNH